jgi:hypothetical protein
MNLKELDEYRVTDVVKFHTELNPDLFDGEHLQQDVRSALMNIANDFIDYLGISDVDVMDIQLSGSNAAYSYTPNSDIDLHVIVDFTKLPDSDVYGELFNSKKTLYNDTHTIQVRGYDVELYVQDSNEKHYSLGEYSVKNNRWIKIPIRRRANLDQSATILKFKKLIQMAELALRSKDIKKVKALLKKLKKYRQSGLDKHGEFGPENLSYKLLKHRGIVDQLYKHVDALHSKELSITEQGGMKFLRPGELGGSYSDDQLRSMGFRRAINGTWYISRAMWEKLIANKASNTSNNKTLTDEDKLRESASGYIPSNAEKDDPRFKTGLTVDVHPDSIQKNASKLGLGKIKRTGIPPTARSDGKIK